jgi:hypothetical protein
MSGETRDEAYLLSENNKLMSENKALWKAIQQIEYERDKWQNTATVLSVKYITAFNAIKEIVDYAELDPDNDEYPVKIARNAYNRLQEE